MIRVYEQTAYALGLLLVYIRDSAGLSLRDVAEHLRHRNLKRSEQGLILRAIDTIDIRAGEELSIDGILKELVSQLGKGASHDADLIETIVDILGLDYPANRFNAGSIADLRKAVLAPEELRELKQKLSASEMICVSCGSKLLDGEMVTIVRSSRSSSHLYCGVCVTPTTVRCSVSGCADHTNIDERDIRRIHRMRCREHSSPAEKSNKVEPRDAINDQLNQRTPDQLNQRTPRAQLNRARERIRQINEDMRLFALGNRPIQTAPPDRIVPTSPSTAPLGLHYRVSNDVARRLRQTADEATQPTTFRTAGLPQWQTFEPFIEPMEGGPSDVRGTEADGGEE